MSFSFAVLRRPLRWVGALAVVVAVLLGQVVSPQLAAALPRGTYWYTLYDIQKAWKITKGAGITVAVVDAGVEASIADLRGNLLPGVDVSGDDPGARHEEPQPGTSGQYGHGTDMAVKIAGSGDGAGLIGIAPQAKILPVDIGAPPFPDSSVAQGISKAVDAGAQIVNVSLGSVTACDSETAAAIKHAYERNVIVVVAAGDDPGPVSNPANCPGALAIGGVDAALKSWSKTPSGSQIAFVAPSYNLVDERLNGTLSGPYPDNDGTSSAAAFTSGVLALLRARFPHETARQIVTRALYNVHNGLGSGHQGQFVNDKYGYGMILPAFALTEDPPAGARNPIYDRFAQQLASSGASSTSPSATGSPAQSSAASPSTTESVGSDGTNPTAVASGDTSSGFPGWAIALIIVAAVIVVGGIVFGATRRGRRAGPPPPSGYRS